MDTKGAAVVRHFSGNLPKINEFVLPHFRNPRTVEQLYDISQLSNYDLMLI